MLEFVNSGLYFVRDENSCINPLLQVGPGSNEKSTESDRIPSLVQVAYCNLLKSNMDGLKRQKKVKTKKASQD